MRARRVVCASIGAAIAMGGGVAHASGIRSLEVVSNRADLISGGDALVAARLAPGTDVSAVRVDVDGADVTGAFALRPNGRYEGLVTGLKLGRNMLTVAAGDGGKRIEITNHPIGGPVFSGPQVTPYFCDPSFADPADPQCNGPTRVELLYRNLAGQFVAYDPANPPDDIQTTTTDSGRSVPFVVERVTGTVNRGVFQMAVLVDPSQPVVPWSAEQPWSRKLFYRFGGACGTEHRQRPPMSALDATALGRGFVVATSSLNVYANNCNDVVSAEAMMMTKELVIERYGELKYTMGNGGSAATMQQHLLAENYPGLLDGLTTSQAFEDHFTQVQGSLDCRVLMHYFWPTSPLTLPGHATAPPNPLFPTSAARLPVWGSHPSNPDNLCGQKVLLFGADRTELVPGSGVACGLPPELIWHPVDNPGGERCGIADFMRAVFGVTVTPDAPKGKGRLAVDNVGVQYGLRALERGEITPEQFVDLNAQVGGIDIDGNFVPQRTEADPAALRIAYETGRINSGTGAASIPELDNRTGNQPDDTGFHPAFHSFSYRERLDKANGHHANHVIWLSRPGGTVPSQFDAMREWLDSGVKPRDTCFMAGGAQGDLTCNGTWRYYGAPRHVAGAPLRLDVVKCQLKPLARAGYPVTFTDEQWATLQATFPSGVCDYSRPGVGQQPPKARWLTFAGGPGGEPLGPAPAAAEFVDAPVGGTVPATLSLTLGPPASFGAFEPGATREYTATTSANVISTAAEARLSVSEPGHLANGAFTLPQPLRVEIAPDAWAQPVANASATITFRQAIGAGDALRTGTYSRTLTFTLSTTSP